MTDVSEPAPAWRPLPGSRRAAVVALALAAIGSMLPQLPPAQAGKAGKKARKRCKRQIGQCEGSVARLCDSETFDRDACLAALPACCPLFEGCRAETAITCLGLAISSISPSRYRQGRPAPQYADLGDSPWSTNA